MTSTQPAPTVLTGIKGFNTDLTCRGYQFAPGQTYAHEGKVVSCKSGFHACPDDTHPLTVFGFYAPGTSRYFEVEQSGEICRKEGDKAASTILAVKVEIGLGELTRRAVQWVWDRATKSAEAQTAQDNSAASATGYQGAASATGDQGAASATGTRGAASATGYQGAASATGDQGAASATGDQGAASATGYRGAASATGYAGRVMGAEGNALFAVEREPYPSYKIISAACGIVGQDGLEPDTWYVCRGGKLVEAAQ